MDGLDIYIDDYTKADPIPLAMLKDLAQSRMLRLFDYDDEKNSEAAPAAPAPLPKADSAALEAALPQPGIAPTDLHATDQTVADVPRVDQG